MTSAEDTVDLGKAGNYAILGKTGIFTVPQSAITGDIAVSPIGDTAMTGFSLSMDSSTQFSTSDQVTGNAYAASYGGKTATDLTAAVSAMETAYSDAAGRNTTDATKLNLGGGFLGGDYGGPTAPLTPGVYTFGTDINLNGDVHFSGEGVYIIQTTGNLKQAANYNVILDEADADTNDSDSKAKPEEIFWQVAGNVEVGTGAKMQGVILAKTKADFLTGSSLQGRVLTQTACNLQSATITQPATPAGARRGLRSV